MTLNWRKVSRDATTHQLRRGDRILVTVQRCDSGWYWFGLGKNTRANPQALDDAKRDAFAHAKIVQDAADRAEARRAR